MVKKADYGSSSRFEPREILINQISDLKSSGNQLFREADYIQKNLSQILDFKPLTENQLKSLVLDIYANKLFIALKSCEKYRVTEQCFEIFRVTVIPFLTGFISHIQGLIISEGYDEIRDCLRGVDWDISYTVVSHVNKKYSLEDLISGEVLYNLQDHWQDHPEDIKFVLSFLNKKKN